jgi:site-specific recombinase XerD
MGDVPLKLLGSKHVRGLRDRKRDFPDAAKHRVKFISNVYTWALEVEPDLVTSNPARDVSHLKTKAGGHHTWTVEEIRQYEAKHPIGTQARLALAILMFTGCRRSDAVVLGHPNVRDGRILWTEGKNQDNEPTFRCCPSCRRSWTLRHCSAPRHGW